MEEESTQNYFNPKEYLTHLVKIDKEENTEIAKSSDDKNEIIAKIISLLTEPQYKSVKEETLLNLKKEKKGDLLLLAIANESSLKNRHQLVAACWESEIDFSKYISFFILLTLDKDYLVSIEAMTVISTMTGPFDEEKVKEGIKKVKETQKVITSEKAVLLNDLIYTLESFITN